MAQQLNEHQRLTSRAIEEARVANLTLAQANRKLEALSSTDALTGMANRRRFDATLARVYANHARSGAMPSLILLDNVSGPFFGAGRPTSVPSQKIGRNRTVSAQSDAPWGGTVSDARHPLGTPSVAFLPWAMRERGCSGVAPWTGAQRHGASSGPLVGRSGQSFVHSHERPP